MEYQVSNTPTSYEYTFSSSSWIKLSEGLRTLPKGRGNSMLPHLYMKTMVVMIGDTVENPLPFILRKDDMISIKDKIRICEVHQKPESYLLKFLKAAVSSSSPLISRGYGSPFTKVNGFISRNEKSKSAKRINDHRIIDTGKATTTNCLPLESKG